MRWFVVGVACLLALGCGAAAPDASERRRPAAAGDVAARLAASLPAGASRCAVARPNLLPARRRTLFLRLSQSDPLAWAPDAPISAFAVAERVAPDGRRSAVALVRVTDGPEAVREWLRHHAPTRIRWTREEEVGPPSFVGDFIDARTLRLSLGDWPVTRGEGPGAEERCAELARSFPEAVEVASRHGEVVVLGAHAHLPRLTEVVVLAGDRAVTISRRVHMASATQAERWRQELSGGDPLALSMMGGELFPDRIEHRQRGPVLTTRMRILWEDLLLAIEDERRMAAAIAEDERRHQPQPADAVDVANLAVVQHQVALWGQRIQSLRGAARRAAAEQLRALLERAAALHPSVPELRRQLARLLIDELEDGAAAALVVQDVLAAGPSDPESWRVLRREAKAVEGVDALAAALVEDGVAPEGDAERAATDLVSLHRRGVSYEFAEGAWLAARAIETRADRLRLRDVTPAHLPVESLGEVLSELVELGSDREGPAALYVLARGDRSSHHLLWHPDQSPVVEVTDSAGGTRLVGVATTGDTRVRAVGRTVADGLLPGPVELALYVVPLGGSPSEPELVVRLAGTLTTEHFVLERASGGAARIDWREVARILGDPLVLLEPRVFPPPELVVDVTDQAEARLVRELAADHGDLRCTEVEHRVRCLSGPESPDAARELLRRFAARRLSRAARLFRQ